MGVEVFWGCLKSQVAPPQQDAKESFVAVGLAAFEQDARPLHRFTASTVVCIADFTSKSVSTDNRKVERRSTVTLLSLGPMAASAVYTIQTT